MSSNLSYQGGCQISARSPARPFDPSFPRGSLAHFRACCLSLGKQLRLGSGLPTTPADFGSTEPPDRRPPASGPRYLAHSQAVAGLLRTSFPSRFLSASRASLRFYSAAAPGGFRSIHNPCRFRFDSTPWPACSEPGSQLGRTPQAVPRITPDLIHLAVPGARLSLTTLLTRP
jgi:hypothetical protein